LKDKPTFLIITDEVRTAKISVTAKFVASAVYYLARPTGICQASYSEIGELIGLDRQTVMRVMPCLVEHQLVQEQGGGNGRSKAWLPVSEVNRSELDTGIQKRPVSETDRSELDTGPVSRNDQTGIQKRPPYKVLITERVICASDVAHVCASDALPLIDNPHFNTLDTETELLFSEPPKARITEIDQKRWFDQWWTGYWLKKDRKKTWVAFKKHVRLESRFQQVTKATNQQMAEMLRRDPQHRPYGATWLNGERWEDEPAGTALEVPSIYTKAEDEG
jgi:hypothetical protein